MLPSIFRRSRLFDDFFDNFEAPLRRVNFTPPTLMRTDVKETETGYELDIDLPGVNKEDVKVELNEGYLNVNATTSKRVDEEEGSYIRKERYEGSFSRSFYVGDALTNEDIKARFENGTLRLSVPKKELQKEVEAPKYIEIEG
ncbi:MAG: Hsp20/alpha crystallin family protein [Clostridiales bacterium]|nr:Hsp20/alpha crystallin family protein [Clostridiales bacterium]